MCVEPACSFSAIYSHKTCERWQRTGRRSQPMLMRCFCGPVGDSELKVARDAARIQLDSQQRGSKCLTNLIRRRSTAPAELHRLPETRRSEERRVGKECKAEIARARAK